MASKKKKHFLADVLLLDLDDLDTSLQELIQIEKDFEQRKVTDEIIITRYPETKKYQKRLVLKVFPDFEKTDSLKSFTLKSEKQLEYMLEYLNYLKEYQIMHHLDIINQKEGDLFESRKQTDH